ncbi:MAG: PDZ domain-containing protein, partial [Chloroflexota bacterium]|nr:PDZ domain-containing protein [Chloroflexota bacterium]
MKRFFLIGALVLAMALIVPAALLAFASQQDTQLSPSVSTNESDGTSTTTTEGDTTTTEDDEQKPWVGLYIMDVTERLAEKLEIDAEDGVAVVKVIEEGPADDAGIERGDVIVSIGDSEISTVSDVRDAVGAASVDDTLSFTIERAGSESTYNVTVGERPESTKRRGSRHMGKSGAMGASGIGATIASLNADLAEKLDIETEEGVVVVRVADGSPAEDAGLQKGDVIVSVDGTDADSVSAVATVVREAEVGDTLSIIVAREGESANLTLSVNVEEGYGFRSLGLNFKGLVNLRGVLSDDEEGPVSITVSKVTVSAIGDGSVTLTPTEDGNDNIEATVTDSSFIFKDGEKAELDDLAIDDEGFAAVIDGEISVLIIGSLESIGRNRG